MAEDHPDGEPQTPRTGRERLPAIFEIFDEWFARTDFEGCSFLDTRIEVTDPASPVRQAAVAHLAAIRAFLATLATEADITDVDAFTRQWHLLMKGSIMSACEGDTQAATRELGELLLDRYGA